MSCPVISHVNKQIASKNTALFDKFPIKVILSLSAMSSRRPGGSSGGNASSKLRMDRQPAVARISGEIRDYKNCCNAVFHVSRESETKFNL